MSALVGCGKAEPEDTTQTATPPPASSTPTASPPPAPTQPPPPPEDVKYKEDIVVTLGDKVAVIDIFNPAFQSSQAALVTNMIYDNLVYCTMDTTYEPELATSWETDDYKTFTFKLRDDVKFHNGEPFTADDVAFTIDKARESVGTRINDKSLEKNMRSSTTTRYTTLKQANVDFIYDISYPTPIRTGKLTERSRQRRGSTAPDRHGFHPTTIRLSATQLLQRTAQGKDVHHEVCRRRMARMIMFENDELDFTGVSSDKADIWETMTAYSELIRYEQHDPRRTNMNDPLLSDINPGCAHVFNNQNVDITLNGYGVAAPTYWGTGLSIRT